jgi:predicted RNA binding protein YcfA (HicA-like mRNA interferase family)
VHNLPKIKPISYVKFCSFLEKKGFKHSRTRGDHIIYVKEGILRPIVVPKYDKIPVFVILNNLRSAGISRDEYLRIIGKI